MQSEKHPLVSIVMATYNRSNILGYAIQSALASTVQDWELIIVGDCCTDDTAEVVAAFGDARIRFVNLDTNYGEQTGPNNLGVSLARGTYLAFLNHDDLWLPDHLQSSIDVLERAGADLVFGQGLVVLPEGYHMVGAVTDGVQPYRPWMDVPATLWVMRRELALQIGPWQPSWEVRCWPSQAWLHRVYRADRPMLAHPRIGAILIQSGSRSNSYLDRQHAEHAFWWEQMQDPLNILQAVTTLYGKVGHERRIAPLQCVVTAMKALSRRMLYSVGMWPPQPSYWLKYWRKGTFIRELRRRRGLKDLPRR
ncbi:glycosyltransferase family 2 protein [Janthinobacterium sp. YR213]|uniref:glycosyltransferase family 2 protein n=1 Tax=Janthinobacterium sp. YR213 TaxID=1881027 RepID=UPI000890A4B0|nr:glycosyltransferase family 2 protein [Janthinobacterium sp. YR213]SDH36309.1 Glycosyl transferase family 2 [Janthinobacterium sp. YR213]